MRLAVIGGAVIGLLSLSCCTITSHWSKPGGTQAEFNKDSYECERDMRQSGHFGEGMAASFAMEGFYERCMVARGYTKNADARQPTANRDVVALSTPWGALDCDKVGDGLYECRRSDRTVLCQVSGHTVKCS